MGFISEFNDLIHTPQWWPAGEAVNTKNQTEIERKARSRSIRGLDQYHEDQRVQFNSFSGADIVAYIHIPAQQISGADRVGPWNETEPVVGVLGTLQTISYSTFREVQPVRSLGKTYAAGYTRGPRCIPATEKVYVKDRGLISIADVNPGDFVQSTGNEFNKVSGVFDQGTKDCKLIQLECGYSLVASYDHPIFTDRGWVKAEELTIDDMVHVCGSTPSHDIDLDVSDDIIKIIAYLIGDGSIHRYKKAGNSIEHRVELSIADSKIGTIGVETREILERLNIPFSDSRSHDSGCIARRISVCLEGFATTDWNQRKYNILHEAILKYGLYDTYSHTKFIPNEFMYGLSSRQVVLFLNRLLSTDGCYSISKCKKYIEFSFGTTSSVLADQVRLLLNKLGINSIRSIERKVGKRGGRCNGRDIISRHDSHRIVISNAIELIRFIKRVNIFAREDKIAQVYHTLVNKINNEYFDIEPGVFWGKVIAVAKRQNKNMALLKLRFPIYNNGRLITPRMAIKVNEFLKDDEIAEIINNCLDKLIDKKFDFIQKKVVSVKSVGKMKVFDLEVDERHSFICNYMKVHNTIAGSMVWTMLDQYVLAEALKYTYVNDYDPSTILIDQIPPFNIIITFNNEYGDVASMGLYGIRMINEGSTYSVDDLITEQTNTYVAQDLDMVHKGPPFKYHKTLAGLRSGSDILMKEAQRRMSYHGSALQ